MDINNLGTFSDINAVWAAYPEGGNEGDYLYIWGVKYRWNKYERIWKTAGEVTESPARKLVTSYGDMAVHNDLHVGGTLYYHRLAGYDLGLFASLADLQAAHPTPKVGQWAFVVHPTIEDKYQIYSCETAGTWTLSVSETTLDVLGFDKYEETLELMQQIANGRALTGYRAALTLSDLPTQDVDPTLGYIVANKLYVWVGTGGDTLDGKYQDCGELRGPQGPQGIQGNTGISIGDNYEAFSTLQALANKTSTEKEAMVPDGNAIEALENYADTMDAVAVKKMVTPAVTASIADFGLTLSNESNTRIDEDGVVISYTGNDYKTWYSHEAVFNQGDIVHIHRESSNNTAKIVSVGFTQSDPSELQTLVGMQVTLGYRLGALIHDADVTVPFDNARIVFAWYNSNWTTSANQYKWWKVSDLHECPVDDDFSIADLAFSDEQGYEIVSFADGHIKTKNFDSSKLESTFKPYQHETKFNYDVECTMPMEPYEDGVDSFSTISVNKAVTASKVYEDRAALYLPVSYDNLGTPTRMVIFGRQGGGTFTDSNNFAKEDINSIGGNYLNIVPYLLSLGYAVLALDGSPDGWITEMMQGAHVASGSSPMEGYVNGNYIAVRSARTVYDMVVNDYNICRDGVFGYGYSQGGWMIWNIAELSGIPFLGLILKSPVVRLETYFDSNSGGTVVADETGVEFPRWKYFMVREYYGINPAAESMTLDDFNAIPKQAWRWAGYDPFLRYATDIPTEEQIDAITSGNTSADLESIAMKRMCHFPVKIWIAKNDDIVGFKRQAVMVKAIRNAGCYADIRMYASGGHHLPPSTWTQIGTFEYRGTTYPLYPPTYEMALQLAKYGGLPVSSVDD